MKITKKEYEEMCQLIINYSSNEEEQARLTMFMAKKIKEIQGGK